MTPQPRKKPHGPNSDRARLETDHGALPAWGAMHAGQPPGRGCPDRTRLMGCVPLHRWRDDPRTADRHESWRGEEGGSRLATIAAATGMVVRFARRTGG